jgi:hypothetical protein
VSYPDLIRASIFFVRDFFAKKMDCRVKPGHDERKKRLLQIQFSNSKTIVIASVSEAIHRAA